jgi:ankyrin repeat protein
MNIRAIILAGVVGSTIAAAPGLAVETNLSLVTAAKSGNLEVLRSLLAGPAKKDAAAAEGTAALVWAASRNDQVMLDLLLGAGADPKRANEFGATALYAAAAHADPIITLKLLAAGADPNAALMSGETPLMVAAGRGNLETMRALLSAKANPNAKETNGGQNALMYAITQYHSAAVGELVRGGADVNAGSKSGFTPLMFAAQKNDLESARILLTAGAKTNEPQPKSGLTPLLIAAAMAHDEFVNLLLDNGADPNAVDARGYAVLHLSVRDSDYGIDLRSKDKIVRIIKSLLAHGAKPDVRLKQAKPALTITEISLQGATPLLLAAEVNNIDAVKLLLAAGADPSIPTEQGTTALMLAAGVGTDVQRARSPEERGVAVETVKLLLDKGLDVNAAGQYGWTALHAATYQGLSDVIELLFSRGANIDAMDAFGQTPLSIAMTVLTQDIGARRLQIPRRYKKEIVELILKLGATPLEKSGVVVVLQRTGDVELGREEAARE